MNGTGVVTFTNDTVLARSAHASVTNGATTLVVTFPNAEPDTTYKVWCTPYFDAGGCWPSSVTTTGFTLNFHTAAGAGASVDWGVSR